MRLVNCKVIVASIDIHTSRVFVKWPGEKRRLVYRGPKNHAKKFAKTTRAHCRANPQMSLNGYKRRK